MLQGVNLAGAEFGGDSVPGVFSRDYTYNSERSYIYFCARNLRLIRLCLSWERLQPRLGGPLDPFHLEMVRRNAGWARRHGARIILNIHNFGRYKINEGGALRTYVVDNAYDGVVKVSGADLADLWVRLSTEFQSEPGVCAYGLMNEPHDLGAADWQRISQAVLSAIRDNGDSKRVLVPGLGWSSAEAWPRNHGHSGWISDPAGNFAYEAHVYFDHDRSGTYANGYDWELERNPDLPEIGPRRLRPFADWCRSNRACGFIGEFGVPGDDPRWLAVLENFLQALDRAELDGLYWAAGEWWGSYPLSLQPRDDFSVEAPQMRTLLGHLPQGSFTTVSSAGGSGYFFAPGCLVSGYGANLPDGNDMIVEIRDSLGAAHCARVLFASPAQINYVIPEDAALGHAEVSVRDGTSEAASGVLWLERCAPALFARAAQVMPASYPDAPDRLFLVLYGTGIRGAAPGSVALTVGGLSVPVLYAGPQPQFAGLDQINAELPPSLAGAGELPVVLDVDGTKADPVGIAFF